MDLYREVWQGHEIVVPREPQRTVIIDGVMYRYGISGDRYYLERYRYERAETLMGIVQRYIKYLEDRHEGLPSRKVEATSPQVSTPRAC